MTDTHLLALCGEGFEQLISLQTLDLSGCGQLGPLPACVAALVAVLASADGDDAYDDIDGDDDRGR